MNRCTLAGGAIAVFACATTHAGLIDPTLEVILEKAAPDESVSTLVFLQDQVDITQINQRMTDIKASRRVRHESVVVALQEVAAFTQPDLLAYLDERQTMGGVTHVHPFWISNAIHVEATPAEIRALAARNDVDYVFHDYEMELVTPIEGEVKDVGPLASGGPEPGIEAVRAPEVWDLGITGTGVLVATLDTGVDGTHEALASRWRGAADSRYADNPEWAWFDPVTNTTFPQAFGSHGTHTMGSVLGGLPGRQVGVAPGAQWIHAATIDRVSISRTVSDSLLAFEWMLDPDGNPATAWDVPQTCSNSWRLVTGHGYPPCDETFWAHLDACEAAGIIIIFAAGNEGGGGLGRPPDRATDEYRTFAVAAVDANDPNWPIASFSSRGPTFCTPDGSEAIKPDIAGPGVNVISSTPNNGYGSSSGTSMSTPHLNGVVALMLEANPNLAVNEVKQIIYETAFDLGDSGEDNAYGWGMVDAFEAVQRALADSSVRFLFPNGRPDLIDPNGGERIRVVVEGQKTDPVPGTGKLYYRGTVNPGEFTVVDMEEVGENEYDAVFPAFECGTLVEYYFSVETTDEELVFNPFSAPDATWRGRAFTGPEIAFTDDFEADTGWTVEDTNGLDAGTWERGVPAGGDGGPDSDSDGSGQCYVTGLAQGEDVDGFYTRLISPVLDASDPSATIEFDAWLNSGPGEGIFIDMSDDGGATWNFVANYRSDPGEWTHESYLIAGVNNMENTDQFHIRFSVGDFPADGAVEAGIDAIKLINALTCVESDCEGDVDGDADVDFDDLLAILSAYGGPCEDCPEDLDGDDDVDFDDLLIVLAAWGPCE